MKTLNMMAGSLLLSLLFYSCDKNEFTPEIADQEFTVAENSPTGTIVGEVKARDMDEGQIVSFEIVDGNLDGIFKINPNSGILSIDDPSNLDYESSTTALLTVSVTDSHEKDPLESSASIKVNISDVPEIIDGLLAYFPFNGNPDDKSNNGIASENFGADPTEDRFGNPNSAFHFDGFEDFIKVNDNSPLIMTKTFSYSTWAKVNGKSESSLASNSLFEQRDDTHGGEPVVIHFNADQDGETRLVLRSSAEVEYVKIGTPAPEYGTWHHYVVTLDSEKNMKLYIDGILKASSVFINDGDFHTGVNRVSIGAHHPSGSLTGAFNGVLDEVFVHDRALSEMEVTSLYQNAAH